MKTGIALAALVLLLACSSRPPPVVGPVRSTVTPSSLASPPAAGVKDCGTLTRYLSRADGNVEVTRDTRLDAYGQRLIAREVCVGTSVAPISGALIFTDCAPA